MWFTSIGIYPLKTFKGPATRIRPLRARPKHYERLREKYEAQANRNMIRGLLKNESLDDFNYVRFMKKYNLTTICDETFVKNEYLKLKEI